MRSGENSISGLASWHRFLESPIPYFTCLPWFAMLRREVKRFMTFGQWSNGMWPLSSLTGPKRTLTHRTTGDALDVHNMFRFVSFRPRQAKAWHACGRWNTEPKQHWHLPLSQIKCMGQTGRYMEQMRNNCPFRVRVHMSPHAFNVLICFNDIDIFKQLTARRLCLAKLFMRTSRLRLANPLWLLDFGTPWCHEHITHLKLDY